MNKIKCQTQLTNENKIQQNIKLYKDQSTQYELVKQDQTTQFEQDEYNMQLVQSKLTYTNGLLSQIESIDFNHFQPRQIGSIQQSTLMKFIQENNNQIHEKLLVIQNQTFLNTILQLTNYQQIKEIQIQIQQYLDILMLISQALTIQSFRKDYSIVDKLSFNEYYCEQQSPGWLLTPTIKIVDSQNFSTDSLIINK